MKYLPLAFKIFIFLSFMALTHAAEEKPMWVYRCFSVGPCEQCTELEIKSLDYCKETGKREPVECTVELMGSGNETSLPPKPDLSDAPEYRACISLPGQEVRSFFWFFVFNIFMLLASGTFVFLRQRNMSLERLKPLLRRIIGQR